MKINRLKFNSSPCETNIMKERLKTGVLHINEQSNNKDVTKFRPADQQGFSGSERLYQKDNISFTGDPKLVQHLATSVLEKGAENLPKWASKMGGANWFDKVLHSVDKNEAFYEATVALVVAGLLKPICVLAMPGAEREDKEMAATKNAVSAGIGFLLSNLILSPCSNAVNRITKSFNTTNPTKYVKDKQYINALTEEALVGSAKSTLGDSFKSSFKKFADIGVSPLKAGVTIALTPIVLNLLFKKDEKKKAKKMKPIDNPINKMAVMNSIRMDSTNKTEEVSPSFKGNLNQPSFKGDKVSETIEIASEVVKKKGLLGQAKDLYTNALGEPIARLFGKAATTKPAQWIVEKASHFDKVSPRWSDLASVAITFFYVNNTRKSKKIDEERKLPLMINNVMVTAASSLAAFLIDKYTDKPMEELLKGYLTKHEVDLHDKSNVHIKTVLNNVLKSTDIEDNKIKIAGLMKNGSEIIGENSEKIKGMSHHLQEAVTALEKDGTVQEAIEKGLIKSKDIQKMAAAGFSQQASNVYKNILKTKSLTVFTITVRFLVTVLMTPLIGRVVALVNKKLGKDEGSKKENVKDNTVPPAGSETIGMKDYMSSLNK